MLWMYRGTGLLPNWSHQQKLDLFSNVISSSPIVSTVGDSKPIPTGPSTELLVKQTDLFNNVFLVDQVLVKN
jgi:hypothetical protein